MRTRKENGLTYVPGKGYEGVNYRYMNLINGKSYVGATIRELERRRSWANWSNAYSGSKIANARKSSKREDWKYEVLERSYSKEPVKLEKMVEEREAYYIALYDSCENGYNSNRGGDGMSGMSQTEESREQISINHRRYQSEEAKKKIGDAMRGREVKESTRRKISKGNTGKQRTPEMRQVQSDRMKGREPVAATIGAKTWVKENGGGYWSNHELSDEAKANMKAAQQKRGTAVIAHFPDGHTEVYNTMLDASKACNTAVGSIFNNLKHSSEQFKTMTGYWFERKEIDEDGTIDTNG